MKYILLLGALLAVSLAQNRGRSSSHSRSLSEASVRAKRDWSGEDFWPWMMSPRMYSMYWGNDNYGGRTGFRSGYDNYGAGNMGGNYGGNMGGNYAGNMGGNMGGNYGSNMGGNMGYHGGNMGGNFGGRFRQYSGNYGWGSYPWYGGWWGDNSGEFFSDRLGVAAAAAPPRSTSGRSLSAPRYVRPPRPSGRAVSKPRAENSF